MQFPTEENPTSKTSPLQNTGRYILGLFLSMAGIGHLTWLRKDFTAQVPLWLPMNTDLVVLLSGFVEIALGLSLLLLNKQRIKVGWIVALFFILVFPGNIAQLMEHKNALDSIQICPDGSGFLFNLFLLPRHCGQPGHGMPEKKALNPGADQNSNRFFVAKSSQ